MHKQWLLILFLVCFVGVRAESELDSIGLAAEDGSMVSAVDNSSMALVEEDTDTLVPEESAVISVAAEEDALSVEDDKRIASAIDDEQEFIDSCGLIGADEDDYDAFCDRISLQAMPRWQVWLNTIGGSFYAYSIMAKRYVIGKSKHAYAWLVRYYALICKRLVLHNKKGKKLRTMHAEAKHARKLI